MITVTVETGPRNDPVKATVQAFGFDRLTPRAARAALEIAGATTGTVWWSPPMTAEELQADIIPHSEYGYRVYPDSARKLYRES